MMTAKTLATTFSAALFLVMGVTGCEDTEPIDNTNADVTHTTLRSAMARETPNVPDADLATLVEGNHTFTAEMYHELVAGEENMMFSPLSIRTAFGLLYAGAAGGTATEIADTLHYGLEGDALHGAFNLLDRTLEGHQMPATDDLEAVEISIANAFWGQMDYEWKDSYLDTLARHYGAGIETMDFDGDPEGCREIINQWVEDETNDRIVDLLPEGSITPAIVAVLTNAVFFKAPWETPFEESMTSSAAFTLNDGGEVTVDMMHSMVEAFPYYAGEGFEAVELPYRSGTFGMVLILPEAGTFSDFEAGLDGALLSEVGDGLELAQGRVAMPKFGFEASYLLNEPLQTLGMETAFVSADLSNMIDNGNLFIDSVFHKTFIAVDERGTEAAAATAILVGETSVPVEEFSFEADSPFIFAIRDRETGSILFMGRVMDPSAS